MYVEFFPCFHVIRSAGIVLQHTDTLVHFDCCAL